MDKITQSSMCLVGVSVGINMVAAAMRAETAPIYIPSLGWFLHGFAMCLVFAPLLGILTATLLGVRSLAFVRTATPRNIAPGARSHDRR